MIVESSTYSKIAPAATKRVHVQIPACQLTVPFRDLPGAAWDMSSFSDTAYIAGIRELVFNPSHLLQEDVRGVDKLQSSPDAGFGVPDLEILRQLAASEQEN